MVFLTNTYFGIIFVVACTFLKNPDQFRVIELLRRILRLLFLFGTSCTGNKYFSEHTVNYERE